jgi:uncharacterized protein (DUF2336 family)
MVGYGDFLALSESPDAEARGQAAHLAATAFLLHAGPADEQAALYAALISFLDDPSVRVRAALAYGLLHAPAAPRPILCALLNDSPIISRAIAQYSPALIDADLLAIVRDADDAMLLAIAERPTLGRRLVEALLARAYRPVTLKLTARADVEISAQRLEIIAQDASADAPVRGALLARPDLPASVRLTLVEAAASAIRGARIVAGAVAPRRLDRLMRHLHDVALTHIGEVEAGSGGGVYVAQMIEKERISTRVMLHAVINGRVLFFADCVAALSEAPRPKVFSILEAGSRPALLALLGRCGLPEAVRNMLARLVFHARTADLADDAAARHYVVTALTEELIVEHDGAIPPELEEAFAYLSEQNIALARAAARGVMAAFAGEASQSRRLPLPPAEPLIALSAA